MKDGKAEVLSVDIEEGTAMRVTLVSREDLDLYVMVMRALAAPGTTFEIVSDTEVVCRRPCLEVGP